MKTVAIESPYAGDTYKNLKYLQRCIRDCLARGETPYASHQMLTDALNDDEPGERAEGIAAGLAMAEQLSERIFFTDYGWSDGMIAAKEHYKKNGFSYVERSIL